MSRNRTLPIVTVLVLMVLAGCQAQRPGVSETVPKKAYGGTLVYALNTDVLNLAPFLAQDIPSITVCYQIHEGLVRHEGNYKLVGALAQSWEASPDGRTWTFHLRDKVVWHDMVPFTAQDVKYTYDLLLDAKTMSPLRKQYSFIREVSVPDALTVKFSLQEPHGDFLDKVTLGIVAKHHMEKLGDLRKYNTQPLGTGPFKLKEWLEDDKIVLEANTSHWLGRPYLDKVAFQIIPDLARRMTALAKGEVHYVWAIPPEEFRKIEPEPRLQLLRYPSLSFAYLALNNQNQLFRDARVREALAWAVDKNAIIRDALHGLALPAHGPYSPANEYYHNPNTKQFGYSPEQSRRLLDEAGYKPGKDQIRQNVLGKRLEFTVLVRDGDETWKNIVNMCQKWFLDIGVKMGIEYVHWTTLNQMLDERSYDAAMLSFAPGTDPDQYNLWHSSAISSGYNDWCYSNPDVDKLLERGRKLSEPAERKVIYFKIQEALASEVAAIWLYHPLVLSALDRAFEGMASQPMAQDRYLYKVYETSQKPLAK